jgi:hypothetical protein
MVRLSTHEEDEQGALVLSEEAVSHNRWIDRIVRLYFYLAWAEFIPETLQKRLSKLVRISAYFSVIVFLALIFFTDVYLDISIAYSAILLIPILIEKVWELFTMALSMLISPCVLIDRFFVKEVQLRLWEQENLLLRDSAVAVIVVTGGVLIVVVLDAYQ